MCELERPKDGDEMSIDAVASDAGSWISMGIGRRLPNRHHVKSWLVYRDNKEVSFKILTNFYKNPFTHVGHFCHGRSGRGAPATSERLEP